MAAGIDIGSDKQRSSPNLADYDAVRHGFVWPTPEETFGRRVDAPGCFNIGYEATDHHVAAGRGRRIAVRSIAAEGLATTLTYARLAEDSARFANALADLGIVPGERVFTLLGRVPALYIAALGTWKRGAVFSPLFSAFGPEPIRARMQIAEARALVTTARLFERKVKPVLGDLPSLKTIILVGGGDGGVDFDLALAGQPNTCDIAPTRANDLAVIHFTSGTTGRPKGAMHVHGAAVAHKLTAAYALDLKPDDIFWCTADPGWVTGTSYGIMRKKI